MNIEHLEIPGPLLLTPRRIGDSRGFFSETFRKDALAELGFADEFVQDNHSMSSEAGVVRGLHFQTPPFAQAKLVRVVRGRMLDVAVDLRLGSPSYGRSVAVELSALNWAQLLIPVGFAHGFCTLEPMTEVVYKVTAPYAPAHDLGILWHDPDLEIAWPVTPETAIVSDKDRRQPRLKDYRSPFHYSG
jgi:dTDP-4-dehydrorhamnose 3,5-epimerase